MSKHTQRWLVIVILIILTVAAAAFCPAGAEGKKLTPRLRIPDAYTPRRGGPSVTGPTSGETGNTYSYTVAAGNTSAAYYDYFMTIDDDPRPGAAADTLYNSGLTTENGISYTFYLPGDYVLFVSLYDSERELIPVEGSDYLLQFIHIAEGSGPNALTDAVQEAAGVCSKGNEFDTAAAINDYLANLVTYDYSFTYYSPEAALLGSEHTCVCNGYSRAYQLIANACGLQCKRVSGKGKGSNGWEAHAWNTVRINGEWYQVDPTWNDSGDDPLFRHIYMGLSDTVIGINHNEFDYPEGLVTCNSLDDNYFVHTGKWTDLAGTAAEEIQAALNRTNGNSVTITADFGTTAWLEGGQYYSPDNTELLQINGHIVAWAMGKEPWTRRNAGAETPMAGTFTYTYNSEASTASLLTGELSATEIASGECGDDLRWTLSTEGVLTVSGTGTMADYSASDQPWAQYKNTISKVVISEGTTNVGRSAFYLCTALTEVEFPETTLTRIRGTAFYGCQSLTAIEIPDSVDTIDMLAFCDCTVLAEIRIPNSVTTVETQLFYGCSSLKEVYLPESVTKINGDAFQQCRELSDVYYAGTRGQWNAISITSSPGYEQLTGASLHTHYLEDHEWGDTVYTPAEDCSQVTAARTCSLDEEHIQTETVSTVSATTKEATCTAKGETTYTAVFENEVFTIWTQTVDNLPALGHILTPHAAAEATCTEDGNTAYWSCERCGKYFSDGNGDTETEENAWIITKQGHHMTRYEAVEATCTEPGSDEHWSCDRCGKYFSDEDGSTEIGENSWMTEKRGHHLTMHEAAAPTCTESGNTPYWSCDRCGKYFSDENGNAEVEENTWNLDATGHQMIRHAAAAPTCTEQGNDEYWFCSGCGKYFSDGNGENEIFEGAWIREAGHHLIAYGATEETCTTAGNSAYWFCDQCGLYFSDAYGTTETGEDSWIIPAAHALTGHEAAEATCAEGGNCVYWSCNRCGKYYSDADGFTEINEDSWKTDPLGHIWKEPEYSWEISNNTVAGVTACRVCSRDSSHTETETVSMDDTQGGSITLSAVPPQDGTDGKLIYSVTFENPAFSTEPLELPVHSPELHPASEASCTEDGNTEYWQCTGCGSLFSDQDGTVQITQQDTVIHAPGHAWGAPEYDWSDDLSAVTAVRKCSRDEINHVDAITAESACEVTKSPTEDHEGSATYRVEFDSDVFETQERIAVIPALKDMNVLRLPVQLSVIEADSFTGIAAEAVIIPDGCTKIGAGAFAGCQDLRYVWIPASVTSVADDAFDGCPGLICDRESE